MAAREFSATERATIRRALALLGICHCGPASRVYYGALYEILQRARLHQPMYSEGQPFEVLAVKLIGSARNNLIEHWDADSRCSLLPAGVLLIDFLENFGIDVDEWPKWAEESYDAG